MHICIHSQIVIEGNFTENETTNEWNWSLLIHCSVRSFRIVRDGGGLGGRGVLIGCDKWSPCVLRKDCHSF